MEDINEQENPIVLNMKCQFIKDFLKHQKKLKKYE